MAQIAAVARVHTTTVSLALRNHPSLPASTRERIQALAQEMGYAPDPALRALVAHRRDVSGLGAGHTLAYLTNWPTRWGWKTALSHLQFYTGAEACAKRLGFNLEHFWQGEEHLKDQRLSEILQARGIQGLIIASQQHELDLPIAFDWSRFSAIKIDYFPHEPRIDIVTNDQRNIVRTAFLQLRRRGYKRIALVLRRVWDDCSDHAWSSGFLGEQQFVPAHERIPIHFIEASDSDDAPPQLPSELRDLLQKHRPDALLAYGPTVLPALRQLGLSVPRDIAFADICLYQANPEIAGMLQHCHKVGERAVELLAGKIDLNARGIPDIHSITQVDGSWCDGASLPYAHGTVMVR